MRPGDIIRMKSCTAVFSSDKFHGSAGFKAPKGRQFVFVLLGAENTDGSDPINPDEVLRALGYVPDPALKMLDEQGQV